MLVVSELAIAVVLLVGAGLLIQSLWRLRQVSPGFESHNLLTFVVAIPEVRYPTEKQAPFYRELVERVRVIAGRAVRERSHPVAVKRRSVSHFV